MTITAVTARIDRNNPPYDATIALVAATPKVLVFDLGQDREFSCSLRNTLLVNAIDTTVVETGETNEAASYQTQAAVGTAIGSIAASAGTTGIAEFTKTRTSPGRFVQITMTSTSGTSVRVIASPL